MAIGGTADRYRSPVPHAAQRPSFRAKTRHLQARTAAHHADSGAAPSALSSRRGRRSIEEDFLEYFGCDGLDQVPVEPALLRLLPVAFLAPAGQGDDLHRASLRSL